MRVLVYYSKGDNYKRIANALSLENINPIILWAENFKEVNSDTGDAFYICEDVPEDKRERIIEHLLNKGIDMLKNIEDAEMPQGAGENETVQFETLEEVEAYINELQLEIEAAQKIRDQFLNAAKEAQEQEEREEDARLTKAKAEKEAKEAADAAAKAEQEKREAEEAAKAALEAEALANTGKQESDSDAFFNEDKTDTENETDGGSKETLSSEEFEYPTREQMIMDLRALKEDNIEVPIPRNATLAQIKPLFDEFIRKLNKDS